jgi:oligopeptide/dipeptide ABC transporter ATP-binding protein
MYAGRVVEVGPTDQIFENPLHPYTRGLLAAIPSRNQARGQLVAIEGTVPELIDPPPSCRFVGRSTYATDLCATTDPTLTPAEAMHEVACFIHHPPAGATNVPTFDRSGR